MHSRSFTPTTIVWTVLLVGILFAVGKTVNPPPPGPPAPPPPKAKAPVGDPKIATSMRDKMMEMMKRKSQHHPPPIKQKSFGPNGKPFNYSSIDVTPQYFNDYQEGRAGEEDLQKRVALAKAEQDKQIAAANAAAAAKKQAEEKK